MGHQANRSLWALVLPLLLVLLTACAQTTHPTQVAPLGKSVSDAVMEQQLEKPGPVVLETIASAKWVGPLSGLLNLNDPQAADLKDHDEPITVFAHIVRHPVYGNFLVDTGVSTTLVNTPSAVGINWLFQKLMKIDKLQLQRSTADLLGSLNGPLAGVLLTHMHFDHIAGMTDVPANVPIYVGTAEASSTHFLHAATQGITNTLLAGKGPLQELPFSMRPAPLDQDAFEAVLDLLGDGSVFAIYAPGHTAGSTAYLVRSTQGPVLLVGDTSHTQWGWDHGVEPGHFTRDQAHNRLSLGKLKALVQRHPAIQVRLGHQ